MNSIPDSSLSVQFNDKIRRIEIDNVWYFNVLDIFEFFGSPGSASNPSIYWKRSQLRLMKQGIDVSDLLRTDLLERPVATGGRPAPHITYTLFMRVVQSSEIREWEPLRVWMAELAQERREEEANPDLAIERAQKLFIQAKMRQGLTFEEAVAFLRLAQDGKLPRKKWTTTLKEVLINDIQKWQYAVATDTEYVTIFGLTAKQISAETGFSVARDGMTIGGRSILTAYEEQLDFVLSRMADKITFDKAIRYIQQLGAPFAQVVHVTQNIVGINLATGKPLLGDGR